MPVFRKRESKHSVQTLAKGRASKFQRLQFPRQTRPCGPPGAGECRNLSRLLLILGAHTFDSHLIMHQHITCVCIFVRASRHTHTHFLQRPLILQGSCEDRLCPPKSFHPRKETYYISSAHWGANVSLRAEIQPERSVLITQVAEFHGRQRGLRLRGETDAAPLASKG